MKLTDGEQRHVRTAIRFLRFKVGGWTPLAVALHLTADTLSKVVSGRRGVTAGLAFAVARRFAPVVKRGPLAVPAVRLLVGDLVEGRAFAIERAAATAFASKP